MIKYKLAILTVAFGCAPALADGVTTYDPIADATPMAQMQGAVLKITQDIGPLAEGTSYYYFPVEKNNMLAADRKAKRDHTNDDSKFCALKMNVRKREKPLIKQNYKVAICKQKACFLMGKSKDFPGKRYMDLRVSVDPFKLRRKKIYEFTCWFKRGDEASITADFIRSISGGVIDIVKPAKVTYGRPSQKQQRKNGERRL